MNIFARALDASGEPAREDIDALAICIMQANANQSGAEPMYEHEAEEYAHAILRAGYSKKPA